MHIHYDQSGIIYEYFSRDGILEKRITVSWDLAQKIIEQEEAKGPFGSLSPTVMLRTLSVSQFLSSIR